MLIFSMFLQFYNLPLLSLNVLNALEGSSVLAHDQPCMAPTGLKKSAVDNMSMAVVTNLHAGFSTAENM